MCFPSNRKLRRWTGFTLMFALAANCFAVTDYCAARSAFRLNQPKAERAETLERKPVTAKPSETAKKRISEAYGKLPLGFETNTGQANSRFKFVSRGRGFDLLLSPQETVLALTNYKRGNKREIVSHALSMRLLNANRESRIVGIDELPGKINYFIGDDPHKWRTDVASYARVKYENVYSGIDLVYHGNRGQVEYDFIVSPGANPSEIKIDCEGAESLRIASNGDLVIAMKDGDVVQHKPVVYQESDGRRQEIEGNYFLAGKRQLGFRLSAYDPSRSLIIDPILTYSTFLGGSRDDAAWDITVDESGNAYVTGKTLSTNFPILNPAQGSHAGTNLYSDVFVTKLNSAGSALVYSTYLGGSTNDEGNSIAIDSSGNAYVTGSTDSTNFPTSVPLQSSNNGGSDVILFKLSSSGSALVFSTYVGGSNHDIGYGVDVDSSGNAYVAGYTISTNFPISNAYQPTGGGTCGSGPCDDAFLFKVNAAGSQYVFSTYLGGSSNQDRASDVAVDSQGNAYVVGSTSATNFPLANALQSTLQGTSDAFVSAFSATGSIIYSTYLGGSGTEGAGAVTIDSSNNAYVTGSTTSTNFPTVNPFQGALAGASDVFVTKINSTGSAILYSTYLGGISTPGAGNETESGNGIALDSNGNIYITGSTNTRYFPIVNPIQTGEVGSNVFVTKINAQGTSLIYSTYIRGNDLDFGNSIDVDSSGNAYVCGHTLSLDFPTSAAVQPTNAGGSISGVPQDAFVLKITDIDGVDITGLIADAGGNPIQNVKVILTGSATRTVFSDTNGTYSIANLSPGGNYTVTTAKTNFNFSPTSQTFNDQTTDQIANFTGSVNQAVLDGKVKDGNGAGVSGVTVTLSGSQTGSVVTGTDGLYTFTNLNAGGTYTVSPSRNSDTFVPVSKTFSNLSSNQSFDFTLVYRITGQATDSVGNPASGIAVTLSGGQASSTSTDVAGNYSFTGLPAGLSYTVTPSKPGYTLTYTFTPPNQTFSNLSANQTANFSFTTATNTSVFPIADAYVQDGTTAGMNFGSATPMLLKTSNQSGQKRDVYLKFDLTNVRRNITAVKLRITAALSEAGSISTSAYSVADTTWTENDPNGINWNNKPARGGTALATVSVSTTTYAIYELNVTSYVVGEKAAGRDLISLALHDPSNSSNFINVNSREAAADKPQLLITTSDNNNAAPSVSLTAPSNGATFTAPANITVSANGSDADGTVSKVDFYAGTTLIGTDNTSPYSITWSSVEVGDYSLRAVATDNAGATNTSSAVNITVNPVNVRPEVSLTAPAGGLTFPAGNHVTLSANASDLDGSITKVEFFTGAVLIGTDTTIPYSFLWSNIPAGAHTLTAIATDNSGATRTSDPVTLNAVWRTGLTPIADTYVRDGSSAATNFGTASELQSQASATAGSNRETYLKFDLNSVSAITSAKLRLFGALSDTSATNVPAAVNSNTNTSWVESGNGSISWNTKLTGGTLQATTTITDNVPRWYEWDITNFIQTEKSAGRNTVTLVVKNTINSTPYATFSSKEAATTQPQLQITTTATRNILFVTGSSTPNTSESALKTRMENLGFTVTLKQAGSTQNTAINTADAYGKAAVLVSSTVTPANVLAKFRNVVVPVLLWEPDLLDDQAMTGTPTTEYGVTTGTQITIVDAVHPLAAAQTGNVSVVTQASNLSWGKPNANAAKIASVLGDATKITLFGYETGAVMPGSGPPGVPAPARRVALFLSDTNGANLTDPQGKALFDAAIKWLTATIVTPTISTVNPTVGIIGTQVSITGYNFGDTQGSSSVTFNGVNATPTSWTSNSIVLPVPVGATSGSVIVVVSGLASNAVAFTVDLPPVDTDGDGLPDAWELQYFGNLNQGANDNPDGDALNNLQEYLQGRNPTVGTVEDTGGGVNLRIYTPLIPTSP